MDNQIAKTTKQNRIILINLMLIGLVLRLWHIDYQSLWLDELYSIEEASTQRTLHWLFEYLKTTDQHPPLYYLFLRGWMSIVGYNEFTLRLPSAIAGTAAIYAAYRLGKEIFNARIGLIVALLATINFFGIHYSQDGRSYIFIFLLSCISYTQLVKLLKKPTLKGSLIYSLISLIMVYTHYFSIFFLFGQVAVVTVFFFLTDKHTRINYLKYFLLSGVIVVLGYLPWIPSLLYAGTISSFWIEPTKDTFIKDYFLEYFGNSGLLAPLLTLFILLFAARVLFGNYIKEKKIIEQPETAALIIIITWILGTCFVPYVRSLFVLPMLQPRYTTPLIPAYLLALAAGIDYIKNHAAKVVIMVVFVLLSLFDLIAVKKYYTEINKAQYREMTQYIIEHNPEHYPIVEQTWGWLHNYYFNRYNYKATFIDQKKWKFVDSIMPLAKTPQAAEAFWFVDGHVYEPLDEGKRNQLETEYVQAIKQNYFGGWVELYYHNTPYDSLHNAWMITANSFPEDTRFDQGRQIAIWSNNPTSPSGIINLPKGRYRISISAMGSDAKNEFAAIKLMMNDKTIAEVKTTAELTTYFSEIDIAENTDASFRLALTNNEEDPQTHKDRNAFVRFIRIKKLD
ncbi:MAG: glycosyltransferase family 39 protein [Flavipsychrobacter sp.]